MTVTSLGGTTVLAAGQSWRGGVAAAAVPEQMVRAARALNDQPSVALLAPVPAAAAAPAPVQAPTPAPLSVSAPKPSSARMPRVTADRAGTVARQPAALALADSPATKAFEMPAPEAIPAPPPFPVPALPVRRALPPPPVSLPPVTSAPPDGELALIAGAVRKLRTDDDPRGALAVLDEHRARFPAGALTREATLARVETLLALDRRAEALRVLDGAAIDELPRARAVRATRGELRAELGRCADARKDFELLLSSNQRDEVAERALYARAACRARTGEADRARADLALYRTLYPQGRFTAEVQRLLEGR
jgi:hypothetical protein